MTKKVMIINADNAPYDLNVKVLDKGANGAPDTLQFEAVLKPSNVQEVFIHSGRKIVIEEV